MFSGLTSGVKALGLRFSLVGLLPFSLLTAYFFGLYAIATAPAGQGVIDAISAGARRVGLTGLVLLLMLAIVLAVVSQPFQIGVVRLLEGYWGSSALGDRAREFAVELQYRTLLRRTISPSTIEAISDEYQRLPPHAPREYAPSRRAVCRRTVLPEVSIQR